MTESLKDAMDTYFANNEMIQELQKATVITTVDGSAGDLVPIEYDAEILSMLVKKAPFLSRLQSIGKVKDVTTSTVAYRRKESGGTTDFIAETDTMPAVLSSVWQSYTAAMKVLVTPISISDLAQKGTQQVLDLYTTEINDALLDQACKKDDQIVSGAAGSYGFAGLPEVVSTNKTDMSGAAISKDNLRTACQTILNAGGTPTAIVTTGEVAAHLEDELYPGVRYVNQTEMVTGYNVTAFRAPNGTDIPIIVDPNVANTDDQRELYVLDETVLEVRDLMKPTPIPLAKTKLATDTVIAQFTTFFCRAETWQYRFYNID
jgi:hypothetical protein